MWPYILLIFIPLVVRHFKIKDTVPRINRIQNSRNYKAMLLFWGFLLLLLILRHEKTGIDILTYKRIFQSISDSGWQEALERSAEIGYSFINKFVSLFTDNFWWIMMITAVLSIWFVARAYLEYSDDAMLTISLFIIIPNFVLLFSGLRQAIAISIGFIVFECAKRKKIIPFILLVLVAMTIHTSAFMLLFMYPLYHARVTTKWLFFVIPLMVLLFIFNEPVFVFLTAILSSFTEYEAEISSTGAYTMLILFSIFAVFSYWIPSESELDNDTIAMRNFLLLSVAIQMFAPLHSLAMRMSYYYLAFIPLLIPRIIRNRSKRWNQVAIVARHIMVVFFIVYFFITAPRDNVLHTFPYHFFWETVR